MSYTRWSSDIKNVVPMKEVIELLKEGKSFDEINKLAKERGAVRSEWYVFDNINGACSVWCRGHTPRDYDYDHLRDIVREKRYEDILGYNSVSPDQQEHLRKILDEVLEEADEEG